MFFSSTPKKVVYVSRSDTTDPLASYSKHAFELDDAHWPSVEHYYQGMKFDDPALRKQIIAAAHPADAAALAKKNKRQIRADWKKVRATVMTRGIYIKCRSHEDAAKALLATGDTPIMENSQYDYYWGCGRDGKGHNTYGMILMEVRDKLRSLESG